MSDDLEQQVRALQEALVVLTHMVREHDRELRKLREAVDRRTPLVQAIGRRLEDG